LNVNYRRFVDGRLSFVGEDDEVFVTVVDLAGDRFTVFRQEGFEQSRLELRHIRTERARGREQPAQSSSAARS